MQVEITGPVTIEAFCHEIGCELYNEGQEFDATKQGLGIWELSPPEEERFLKGCEYCQNELHWELDRWWCDACNGTKVFEGELCPQCH